MPYANVSSVASCLKEKTENQMAILLSPHVPSNCLDGQTYLWAQGW